MSVTLIKIDFKFEKINEFTAFFNRYRYMWNISNGVCVSSIFPTKAYLKPSTSLTRQELEFNLYFVKRHRRYKVDRSTNATVEYYYSYSFFTYSVERRVSFTAHFLELRPHQRVDLSGKHCQVGSLAGVARLHNNNAGFLRCAQWERKSHVEQKSKSSLDFDFLYEWKVWKRGLSILR